MGRRLAVLAAASLIASPAIAQSSAAKLSVANSVPASARSGADLENANELRGGFIIPLIAVVAIILGILAATGGGNGPSSP